MKMDYEDNLMIMKMVGEKFTDDDGHEDNLMIIKMIGEKFSDDDGL